MQGNQRSILSDFDEIPPRYLSPQDLILDWLAAAHARAESNEPSEFESKMRRFIARFGCDSSRIASRAHEFDEVTHRDWERMRLYNVIQNPHGAPLDVRMQLFQEGAERVFAAAYRETSEPPRNLLHVTCTGYVSPSAAQKLVESKGWGTRTQVTHLYHMGCSAAIPAIRVACGLGSLEPDSRADIVHTEFCTLHLDPLLHAPEQLVVQSLFADGAIRYSVQNGIVKPGFEILSMHEVMARDSGGDMRWITGSWGFQMSLSSNVPSRICSLITDFMKELFRRADRDYSHDRSEAVFAVHPGGPKIIDLVQQSLELQPSQLAKSREVLRERGNMSSATLPHIWNRILRDKDIANGTLIPSVAFGPGLTLSGVLLRKREGAYESLDRGVICPASRSDAIR
ncbi:MAG TPA: 3-oxoacyl-[acyl-carrier-protein] synthase III C-terminal domain-containing protein [Bdellovibrionota bacterium]|nr:3-oxoacyl-[acyl-carrier-protein] synthase III C-terminal domain-containing protein [Bdellovibrionota bacterium]